MDTFGLIGLGLLGSAIASRLPAAGYTVLEYDLRCRLYTVSCWRAWKTRAKATPITARSSWRTWRGNRGSPQAYVLQAYVFLARTSLVLAVAVASIALSGCGHKKHARVTPPPPAGRRTPVVVQPGDTETGIASWYGHPYHGRAAANGEIYDMEKMTAAHRTLPFNTWVRVYDLDNNKTTDVRIIDRGPFIDGRIIDLSHAAAREIELIGPGVAKVRVEVIRTPANVTAGLFAVQVGAFRDRNNAEGLRQRMAASYGSARLLERPENPGLWRVLVGAEPGEEGAGQLAGRIRQDSLEKIVCFVVRIDSM